MLRTIFVLTIAAWGVAHAVRAPFFALLLYLWIAYFRPEVWVWGGVIATLPLSLISGIFLLAYSIFSHVRFRLDLRTSLLFILLAHSLISTLLSPYIDFAWPYWTDFAKSTIVTYLMACIITTPREYRLVLLVIAASLGFEVVKQGWAQLLFNPGAKNYNTHPLLGDENGVALGVLMLMPMISALAQTTSRKWAKRGYSLFLIGAAYRAISTYSRGAFLSGGVLVGLAFARSKHKLRTAVGIAAMALLIVPVLPEAFWDRMSTIAFSESDLAEEDSSSRGRLHFWRVAVDMANANPVFGVGHNAFTQSYDQYDYSDGEFGRGRAVHSTWFGVLAEYGYVGSAFFGLTFLLALTGARRVRRAAARRDVSPELGVYATALESSLLVFCVGGTFLSAQYTEMLWHFFGLSLALTGLTTRMTTADLVKSSEGVPVHIGLPNSPRWSSQTSESPSI